MDIYTRKSYWKWYLAAGGTLIVILSLAYTRFLGEQLAEREKQQVEQYLEAQRTLASSGGDPYQAFYCDISFQLKVVQSNTTVPILLLNERGGIDGYTNVGEDDNDSISTEALQKVYHRLLSENADTIHVPVGDDLQIVMYGKSQLLKYLEWYPYVQLFLISVFIGFGYAGFSASRRVEQNKVWLGMAKETAHQLGTPITAILGWIETLKAVNEDRPDNQEMLLELRNDVTRLELVADRFSKIGATPELTPVNLYDQLEACRAYMQRRAPRKTVFQFPDPEKETPLKVFLNPPLFDWVIENLLRNAIDAMEKGEGSITVSVYQEKNWACIDVTDTGKGIPSGKHNTVFKPGYSTKTRGWGLGLSLARRIMVEYHEGKIFVKRSELGQGTTFTIKLPLNRKMG
ncbi:MAG TPA: HAMP domain-containing sensor histidine kinase [Saprospiraceae bacterium]|nr:HAMP domain-containing sensor histidine kinase [Saprospiraceae bacterium]